MARSPGRRYLPVRISHDGRTALQRRADDETEGNVSELVRRMLKYAMTRMPPGWQ